jgi:hypothetical protein
LIIILLSISCIGFDLPKMVMFSVKLKKADAAAVASIRFIGWIVLIRVLSIL